MWRWDSGFFYWSGLCGRGRSAQRDAVPLHGEAVARGESRGQGIHENMPKARRFAALREIADYQLRILEEADDVKRLPE